MVVISVNWRAVDVPPLIETISWIQQYTKKVIVIGPTLTFRNAVPSLLAKTAMWGQPPESILASSNYARDARIDADLRMALKGNAALYVSMLSALCPDVHCKPIFSFSRDPFMFDTEHLTVAGARKAVQLMADRELNLEETEPSPLFHRSSLGPGLGPDP